MKAETVILANGGFPAALEPLSVLRRARRIVCCDGAAVALSAAGLEPAAVVGDLDSLPAVWRKRYADRLAPDPGQADNDLAKAFRYCLAQGWRDLAILGATGLREDHTLGNLAWLVDFAREARVRMVTDHGLFLPVLKSARFPCEPGQAVSIFSFDPATAIRSTGLVYPLRGLRLTRWWQATLNQAAGRRFEVRFRGGPLLVFLAHPRRPRAGRTR